MEREKKKSMPLSGKSPSRKYGAGAGKSKKPGGIHYCFLRSRVTE
jgi:hypothetical protein